MSKSLQKPMRSQTVGCRLDPKLDYLLTLAARDAGCSISTYVERAIRQALASHEQEPGCGIEYVSPAPAKEPWESRLWAEDESERLFLLATYRSDLLSPPERRLWTLLSGSIRVQRKKLNPATFYAAFNDPMVNKTHLAEAE